MNPTINSRAGLVALVVFALIISLVSAAPILTTDSGLCSTLSPRSNPSLNGPDHIQLGTAKMSSCRSIFPAAPRDLTRRQHISTDMDDQLVRRGFFSRISHMFKKVGNAIKKGVRKVRHAIKRVVHGIKKVGANLVKYAKYGLKVVQTVGKVVGKVAKFIPFIGQPIGMAADGVSKFAGTISDKIPVKLPGGLEKGVQFLEKADNIVDSIPRRRDFSEEEAFQQRDISEAYYFEGRDDNALEDREESYLDAYERDIFYGDTYH